MTIMFNGLRRKSSPPSPGSLDCNGSGAKMALPLQRGNRLIKRSFLAARYDAHVFYATVNYRFREALLFKDTRNVALTI